MKKIRGIPIELGGVRSFMIEIKKEVTGSVFKKPAVKQTQQEKDRDIIRDKIALLCKVTMNN